MSDNNGSTAESNCQRCGSKIVLLDSLAPENKGKRRECIRHLNTPERCDGLYGKLLK